MNIAFIKLHVAGNDFILVDRDRRGHEGLSARDEVLGAAAQAMLNRRRGVGGRGVIYLGGPRPGGSGAPDPGSVHARVVLGDGSDAYAGNDAFLCAARWVFDSGRASGGKIRFDGKRGRRVLTAVDSRSFAMELDPPLSYRDDEGEGPGRGAGRDLGPGRILGPEDRKDARLDLVVDGLAAVAYPMVLDRPYVAAIAGSGGPGPKRVRTALAAALPGAVPVVVRPAGRDLVRFVASDAVDRTGAAAVAVAGAVLAGVAFSETAAEWRGRGAAAAFADFGTPGERPLGTGDAGPGALIDRGRFWVEWKDAHRLLVAGTAEYAFEGSFDFFGA